MTDKPLVILGSARKQGDTSKFVNKVFDQLDHTLIDLLDFSISPYDYSGNYPVTDDFFRLTDMLLQHRVIVFATPVYWYAMSGPMKTFFDRLTDLVTIKKQQGRELQGKYTWLIAVGTDPELPDGFEMPFKLTSGYLNMIYEGAIYYSTESLKTETQVEEVISSFRNKIKHH
jgi:multimeric flavodoxin WrbA